ncbi:MAG: FHA domain-containing protein [Lachnospiraceae bacterium]|nr:FHA domain-containing protein [Lachnospiraceae bacterium]
MNIIKCENGHFFDNDRFKDCPHCKKREELNSKNKKIFSFEQRKKNKNDLPAADQISSVGTWEKSRNENSVSDSDGDFLPEDAGQAYYSEEAGEIEEVVGWLVCIKGMYKGRSFELHCGRNGVGSGEMNEIPLTKEVQLASDRHFVISYEDRSRMFYIVPGNSGEFVYLNGVPVLEMTAVYEKNIIDLGSCAFMLVAFCDEELSWETI